MIFTPILYVQDNISTKTTEIYAEKDVAKARAIARKYGISLKYFSAYSVFSRFPR